MKKEESIQLVSSSPRRKKILSELFKKVSVVSFMFEEAVPNNLLAKEVSEYLSLYKMNRFLESKCNKQQKIITADTVVCYPEENRRLGKPKTKQEAKEMLLYHFGKRHSVFTSVSYFNDGKILTITDEAKVQFKKMREIPDDVVERYLSLIVPQGPMDKAGAYGIQEEDVYKYMVERVDGDINTVIGFPLKKFVSVIINGSSGNVDAISS